MKFAMAAYGWKLYAYKNGLMGIASTLYNIWLVQSTCTYMYVHVRTCILMCSMAQISLTYHPMGVTTIGTGRAVAPPLTISVTQRSAVMVSLRRMCSLGMRLVIAFAPSL